MTTNLPRRLWTLLEPLHAVTYFAAPGKQALADAGYRGFWRGYFAGRAAPLGPVGAAPVTALFYGFAPPMVARALPAVWEAAPPAAALAARRAGSVAALVETFAGHALVPDDAGLPRAVDLLRAAVEAADRGGRALGAANAELPWPDGLVAGLWHGATVLRELRGDGHVAALLTAGLSGLDAIVLRSGRDLDRAVMQPTRGWTDEEWQAAAEDLRSRGLLDGAGRVTERGAGALDDVEAVTDRLAAQPWRGLGEAAVEDLAGLLAPFSRAAATLLPASTPIGLPTDRPA